MTTPIYKGQGQPNGGSGGWLGSLLGGTPMYGGVGQPAQKPSALGTSQPVYKPASSAVTPGDVASADANATGCGPIAIVIPRQVIEQQ